ncbi:MAG: hypothetical protein Q9195_006665 [Heterodermia aff. obscurata]
MPSMLEDPSAPPIYRTSGAPPYPSPTNPQIPPSINPRQVTLRDRITIATLIPFSHPSHVPPRLLNYLCSQFNLEIEKGDTYPIIIPLTLAAFGAYWFQNFAAVMLLGEIVGVEDVVRMERGRTDWEKGYTYSVFNLVYETNLASCRIWDALGFKRIGRVKACGNLRSHPDELVDAIIYGRDLGPEGEDFVSEERFDKIRFYLKHGKYPNGADRAEKSRLRSAATHYKLIPAEEDKQGEERLMLKDKEVVSDPQRQYEIARHKHAEQHGGINKTTAAIAEMYHWVRIKETVSMAIKNCPECKDATKIPTVRPVSPSLPLHHHHHHHMQQSDPNALIERLVNFDDQDNSPASYTPALYHPHHQSTTSPDMQALQTQLQQELHGFTSSSSTTAPHGLPLDPQIVHDHEYQRKYGDHQINAYHHHHGTGAAQGEDAHYELDMEDLQDAAGEGGHGGVLGMEDGVVGEGGQDDTRLATARHVTHHDQPMAFVHEEGHDRQEGKEEEDDLFGGD